MVKLKVLVEGAAVVTVDRPSAISKISHDSAVPILARPHPRQESQLRQAWIAGHRLRVTTETAEE